MPTCAQCRSELEPEAILCSRCGARVGSRAAASDWREQVRETVARHKERRKTEEEKRGKEARQLSIFPDPPGEDPQDREVRLRRAEIRARVEDRIAKRSSLARSVARFSDAGDVPLSRNKSVMTARKLEPEPEPEDPRTAEPLPVVPAPAIDEVPAPRELDLSLARPEPLDPEEAPELLPALTLASGLDRLVSGAIDVGFVALIQLTLFYLTTHLVSQRLGALPRSALVAMGLVGVVMAAGYFLFFWGLSGQTLGKLLTGTRVVDRRGQALGFGRAGLRLLAAILSAIPLGAGFIGLWSHRERRGWHDRLAGTKVVRG